jgi:hypothetical protein
LLGNPPQNKRTEKQKFSKEDFYDEKVSIHRQPDIDALKPVEAGLAA